MRVNTRIRGQHLSADKAYERFFDGYYNLGEPGEVFVGTLVMSPPSRIPKPAVRRNSRVPKPIARRRARKTGR